MYYWQFSKKNFLYPIMEKHKFASISLTMRDRASISLTMRDRAISSKFLTHRVSKNCTLGNSSYSIKLKNVKFLKFHLSSSILLEIENVGYLKNLWRQ